MRAVESSEARASRLEKKRDSAQRVRAAESPEARATRQKQKREH